jgi:molybdopterin-guanine dinucleotide biosynthesis protein A
MQLPPLYGLVLAGGASTRMGHDKAALSYHGRSQLHWAFELLNSVCERTYISVRAEQTAEATRASLPQIIDRQSGIGPIAGISAAFETHPEAAWLVLACDLPFLSSDVLTHLTQQRNPKRVATAYRSSHDQLPEPLCTIWEPKSYQLLQTWIVSGRQCPRKLLINSEIALIDQLDPRGLDNVNTPDEFNVARKALDADLQS